MSAEKFTFFWKGPFSQWHRSNFTIGDLTFNCAEQYMMYCKALLFRDYGKAEEILNEKSPRKQKELGRQITDFDTDDWLLFRRGIVYNGNYEKFRQSASLTKELISTGSTTLVEASPEDCIWGIGLPEDHPDAKNRATWKGLNLLGEVLTDVREALRRNS